MVSKLDKHISYLRVAGSVIYQATTMGVYALIAGQRWEITAAMFSRHVSISTDGIQRRDWSSLSFKLCLTSPQSQCVQNKHERDKKQNQTPLRGATELTQLA